MAAEPLAQRASQALPLQVARAARAAQPEELLLELSSPPVALQAEVVLPGERAASAQQSSPRVWLPEPQASPPGPQAVPVDARSEPEAASFVA